MANEIYTIGDGTRTQMAQRVDGMWFIRTKWRGLWGKWRECGPKKPFLFGMYVAPNAGKARLPDVAI